MIIDLLGRSTIPTPPSSCCAPVLQVEIPGNQSLTEKVSSPMATLSSNVDPWPHYIMSGACEPRVLLILFYI